MTDHIKKLFEDAGLTDERMEEIAAHFRCAVDEQVMQELASSLTFMKEQVTEELVDQLDNYLHEAFSELEQRLTAVDDLVQAVAEKSQIYGLNEEESGAINTLQKQVVEQSRSRLEEIFDTLEKARHRKQRRTIVKAAKRVARVQWRRAGGGGWQRVELHRQIADKQYIRNEERLSFREFVEAKNPFDKFLRNYRRGAGESIH